MAQQKSKLSRARRILTPAGWLLVTTALLTLTAPLHATRYGEQSGQDASVRVGGHLLRLQAQGTREMLFVDVYQVGVYLAHPVKRANDVRDAAAPVAVCVRVLYDGSMPGKIPTEWWNELVPTLSPAQEEKLRTAFSRLSDGDAIWITYAPRAGTTVRYGRHDVVLEDRGHELMNAVLDLWLGPSPVSTEVSEELERQLGRGR